jgi:glutamate-1-semialdehyde 2,1-aminomutase
LPLAAFGGKAAIMDRLAPVGDVYQAGTLAGNPVAVAAGLAMLRKIRRENPYPQLDAAGRAVADGLSAAAAQAGVPVQVHQVGSLVSVRIGAPEVPPWEPVPPVERQGFAAFFHAMREEGVLLPPSPREALFLSTAHDPLVQASIAEAAARAWPRVAQGAEAGTSA